MTLALTVERPFARGGNRLCYVHPQDPDRCVKVRRPDFPLAALRRQKGFPKNLKPLSSFDDNREEARVIRWLERRYGERVFQYVSRCYGFTGTDQGPGLVLELIRNADGTIAPTLKKYLWDNGATVSCQDAIAKLCHFWESEAVPSRDLLLHNLVAPRDPEGRVTRIVVIDGLGSSSLVPFAWLPPALKRAKARRKTADLHKRIAALLAARQSGEFPGKRGLLLHNGSQASAAADRGPAQ